METFKAEIKISLRKGILDVQGKTVEQSLHSMEYQAINNVRIGKFVELNIDAESSEQARAIAEEACKKLIANPIIEDFQIEMVK